MLESSSLITDEYISPTELDVKRRRSLGIYYTPRSAATLLARWAIREPVDKVLEPSFGGCTILEAAVKQLRVLGCAQPAIQLSGFDVDESAFGHLRRVLGRRPHDHFLLQDFLTVEPKQASVDTVIANPPFVSYHRMNENQRDVIRTWRSHNRPPFAMTASLWAYFLVHSLSFLKVGGRLAFVLPFAAYSSDYSRPILEMLQMKFQKLALYRMREQLFIQAGAEERTVILLADGYLQNALNNCERIDLPVANIQELDGILASTISSKFSVPQTDPILHSDGSGISLLQRGITQNYLCHLGSVMDVKIGEVVGDTGFLVKSADEWDALGIPTKYLYPLVTRTRQVPGIQITKRETSSFYSAVPLLLSPGRQKLHTVVRDYLDSYPSKLRAKNITFEKRSPWYAVGYVATASAFIGSMAHESPKIIWNAAKVSCANGLYKLYRRKETEWGQLLAVASLTTPFRLSAELRARVRGSGVLKLEPSDVAKLLIPAKPLLLDTNASRKLMQQIDTLVRSGEYESATRLADAAFYPPNKFFNSQELNILRDQTQDLRRQRLPARSSTLPVQVTSL